MSKENTPKETDNSALRQTDVSRSFFKAFIRVVKSITKKDSYWGFDTVEVIREPLIEAKDKAEVKAILLEKYPHFFQNGKVYEKETKDQAQFFYVVIFPLYPDEIRSIKEGEWTCDYCKKTYENKYIERPLTSSNYVGLNFCGTHSNKSGNDLESDNDNSCFNLFKNEHLKNWQDSQCGELPDQQGYITSSSPNYIYKITEKSTGKCYIGKTKNAPFFRWWNHLKHSSSPFGLYFRQSNLKDWIFEVLEELPNDLPDTEIFKIESKYIQKFDSINNGYNSLISNKTVFSDSGTLFDAVCSE